MKTSIIKYIYHIICVFIVINRNELLLLLNVFFQINVVVLLTMLVNLTVVFAELSRDDDKAVKGKREAPMAEPSTDYTPPRLEAPYATYSPLLANGNSPQSYYQSSSFSQQGPTTPAVPYEYNRYTGVIPLPSVDGNDLGNGLKPGPPYNDVYGLQPPAFNGNLPGRNAFNQNNGYGGFGNNNGYNAANVGPGYDAFNKYNNQNAPGQHATSYAQLNGLGPHPHSGPSLNVYGENGNAHNPGFYGGQPSLEVKGQFNAGHGQFNAPSPFNNAGPSNYGSPVYGNPSPDVKYPSTAALVANEPGRYVPSGKYNTEYNQPQQISLNTQAPKNSRPVALTPPHLQRKPASYLNDPKNPNFRPSFLLGSSVLSSTPAYEQPTLTSLGTLNPYLSQPQQNIQLIPNVQYSPPLLMGSLPLAQRDYLPAPQPQFLNGYQALDNFGGQQLPQQAPVTSYGDALPETIIYTKSSLYSERYGHGAPT